MKINTKTGDDGYTICFGGEKILKCDPRIEAVGSLDELTAAIGLVRCVCKDNCEKLSVELEEYQSMLIEIMGIVSAGGNYKSQKFSDDDITKIDSAIDVLMEKAGPLKEFVHPGSGSEVSARLHVARATCRRAERSVVAFSQQSTMARESVEGVIKYLNRLGDLFFAMSLTY